MSLIYFCQSHLHSSFNSLCYRVLYSIPNSVFCSFLVGNCTQGYYCPRGQSDPQAFQCPIGHYCPSGIHDPILCPSGTYQDEPARWYCRECPASYFCDKYALFFFFVLFSCRRIRQPARWHCHTAVVPIFCIEPLFSIQSSVSLTNLCTVYLEKLECV